MYDELSWAIKKGFDEIDKKWKKDTCKLPENKESDLNQVSNCDSGGKNDDTFIKNNASLSAVEIKNEVSEVKTNDNQNGVSLNINKEVTVNKVNDDCKTSENYNDVIENVVSESGTLNNDSDDESLVGVEISDEVVVVKERCV